MADCLLASVLHLTDLHLGKDFSTISTQLGRLLAGNWLTGPAHDKAVLRVVGRGIDMARLQLRRRFDQPEDFDFDVTVVSGDILAQPFSPPPNSYDSFAYPWLTNTYRDDRGYDIGLHLPAERLVVIPGNHDRIGLMNADYFVVSSFMQPVGAHTPGAGGAAAPYQTRQIPGRASAGRQLYVLALDTNDYSRSPATKGFVDPHLFPHIISDCTYIHTQDPHAFIIVLLHHAPYDLSRHRHGWLTVTGQTLGIPYVNMELENWQKFQPILSRYADLVLFGHLHEFEICQEESGHSTTPAFSSADAVFAQAPSLSQHGSPLHGFNIYLFVCDAQGQVTVEVLSFTYRENGFYPGNYMRIGKVCR